jgi:hypothetical protein
MLPWLIAVLLVLNLGLFWWGRYHQVPIDPELPPLPAAAYTIELLDRAGEEDAQTAGAPSSAGDGLASVPEQDAAQSEATPPAPQLPSEHATADAALGTATYAGEPPVIGPTAEATAPQVADPGGLAAPKATPGVEALVPVAIAAGAAGTAVAAGAAATEAAPPKAVKKRKIKRRKPAKPVEPFPDF